MADYLPEEFSVFTKENAPAGQLKSVEDSNQNKSPPPAETNDNQFWDKVRAAGKRAEDAARASHNNLPITRPPGALSGRRG